jgi:hypothetical protein
MHLLRDVKQSLNFTILACKRKREAGEKRNKTGLDRDGYKDFFIAFEKNRVSVFTLNRLTIILLTTKTRYTWSPKETNSQPSFSEYVSFFGSSARIREIERLLEI